MSSPIWGSRPDTYYSLTVTIFFFVGRPLWREYGSVFCICCWPSPALSFSGLSSLGLVTIFYCLRFETSPFVASYDSQGNGGGIRPRPHWVDSVSLRQLFANWIGDTLSRVRFIRCNENDNSVVQETSGYVAVRITVCLVVTMETPLSVA
jgi:hypothetical protein